MFSAGLCLSVPEVEDDDGGQEESVVEVSVQSLLEGGGTHHGVSTEPEVRAVVEEEVGGDRDLDQGEEDHCHNLSITSQFITSNPSIRQLRLI